MLVITVRKVGVAYHIDLGSGTLSLESVRLSKVECELTLTVAWGGHCRTWLASGQMSSSWSHSVTPPSIQEMMRQQNNERLRRQFAQKANVVGQWIERHLDMVASVGIQKGSLEDHLNKLKGIEKGSVGVQAQH